MKALPIPEEGVHTVRAIPSILNALLEEENPSLCELCTWTNTFYNKSNLNLCLYTDDNILQIVNALHLSGLLYHRNIAKTDESIIRSDDDES